MGFRQARAFRSTHNGVLAGQRAAIKRKPISMPDDLCANLGLDHRITEYFGDDYLWLPRHNDPADIKHDVQDDFSRSASNYDYLVSNLLLYITAQPFVVRTWSLTYRCAFLHFFFCDRLLINPFLTQLQPVLLSLPFTFEQLALNSLNLDE